jgi:hypothetical protein
MCCLGTGNIKANQHICLHNSTIRITWPGKSQHISRSGNPAELFMCPTHFLGLNQPHRHHATGQFEVPANGLIPVIEPETVNIRTFGTVINFEAHRLHPGHSPNAIIAHCRPPERSGTRSAAKSPFRPARTDQMFLQL